MNQEATQTEETSVARSALRIGGMTILAIVVLAVGTYIAAVVSYDNRDHNVPAPASTASGADVDAATLCVDALRSASKFPSSFDFSPITDPPQTAHMNDGSYLVRVDFTVKNGFGNTVPMDGHCTVKGGAVTALAADPR